MDKFFLFADSGAGPGQIFEATTRSIQEDNRAVITLPAAGLPSNAMYMLWAVNDAGVSRPVFVNQAEAWWIGPNAGQAGQRIAIFGRNFSRNGSEWATGVNPGSAPASVWIAPQSGGTAIQVQVTAVNPYRVEFEIPANLAAGNYALGFTTAVGEASAGRPLSISQLGLPSTTELSGMAPSSTQATPPNWRKY